MIAAQNYFEFFNLPTKFFIDTEVLRSRFFENSRKYHPDFNATRSDNDQADMLAMSTLNNNAYKTLNNFNLRLKYILELHQLIDEKEKNALPPDFLMEMMEINESLMEATPEAIADATERSTTLEKEIEDSLLALCKKHDEEPSEQVLLQIKELYHKQKYLLRIKESLNKLL